MKFRYFTQYHKLSAYKYTDFLPFLNIQQLGKKRCWMFYQFFFKRKVFSLFLLWFLPLVFWLFPRNQKLINSLNSLNMFKQDTLKKEVDQKSGNRQNSYLDSQQAFTCSKSTIWSPEQCVKYVQWRNSGIFIINFEHISHVFLMIPLLTLDK